MRSTLHVLPSRTVALLVGCVALAATGMFASVTIGAIVVVETSGSRAASGIPQALGIFGTAGGAFVLGALMQRRGRRIGLGTGWILGAVGGILAAVSVQSAQLVPMLVGMFAIGVGNGASQLSRYAAAESAASGDRARALSWVVWANAIGAVAGPLSIGWVGERAVEHGLREGTGGFIMVACALAAAAAASTLYREQPAPGTHATAGPTPDTSAPARHGMPAQIVPLRLAVAALVTAQACMVMVMAITPVHLSDGGHAYGIVGTVMGGHFVGMFALAPLVGVLVASAGALGVLVAGLMVLAAGAATAAVLPVAHGTLLSLPLLTVGLGWCMCFVAASTAISRSTEQASSAAARQGRIDSFVWTCSATASVLSGVALSLTSYAGVATFAAAVAAGAAAASASVGVGQRRRRTA